MVPVVSSHVPYPRHCKDVSQCLRFRWPKTRSQMQRYRHSIDFALYECCNSALLHGFLMFTDTHCSTYSAPSLMQGISGQRCMCELVFILLLGQHVWWCMQRTVAKAFSNTIWSRLSQNKGISLWQQKKSDSDPKAFLSPAWDLEKSISLRWNPPLYCSLKGENLSSERRK